MRPSQVISESGLDSSSSVFQPKKKSREKRVKRKSPKAVGNQNIEHGTALATFFYASGWL